MRETLGRAGSRSGRSEWRPPQSISLMMGAWSTMASMYGPSKPASASPALAVADALSAGLAASGGRAAEGGCAAAGALVGFERSVQCSTLGRSAAVTSTSRARCRWDMRDVRVSTNAMPPARPLLGSSSGRRLGDGAAEEAPTAPHATPRAGAGPRGGPAWFWARWPARVAFGLALLLSGVAHCTALPFDVPRGFEVKDVEGEAAIPVDVMAPDEPPPPPPPPAPKESTAADKADREKAPAARPDAGVRRDAGPDGSTTDASFDGEADRSAAGA